MSYYKNIDRILKIWNPVNRKVKKVTSITFDKTFSNKSSDKLLKSLADDSNQKLNTQITSTNINFNSDKSELIPSKKKLPISNLISLLSSALFFSLRPRSSTFPLLSLSAQI